MFSAPIASNIFNIVESRYGRPRCAGARHEGQVDAQIKRTLIDKFGPVRSVRPSLVFEIAFEGIGASSRHKSGVALRFPRINRLRPDKPLHEVSSLSDLLALLPVEKSG